MIKRTYHHGDLRRTLLAAAVEVIDESGPAALSLRDLARRAGVSHAAPTHHFRDKAGLLTALAAEGYRLLATELINSAETSPAPAGFESVSANRAGSAAVSAERADSAAPSAERADSAAASAKRAGSAALSAERAGSAAVRAEPAGSAVISRERGDFESADAGSVSSTTPEPRNDFLELGVAYVRFAITHRAHFEVMFRPELYHPDDPELAVARQRARDALYAGAATLPGITDARDAGLASWSMAHGFAMLWLNNSLPDLGKEPDIAARTILRHLKQG